MKVAVNGQARLTYQRPPLPRNLPLPLPRRLPRCQGNRVSADQIVFARESMITDLKLTENSGILRWGLCCLESVVGDGVENPSGIFRQEHYTGISRA
jgi:hypothetical protein